MNNFATPLIVSNQFVEKVISLYKQDKNIYRMARKSSEKALNPTEKMPIFTNNLLVLSNIYNLYVSNMLSLKKEDIRNNQMLIRDLEILKKMPRVATSKRVIENGVANDDFINKIIMSDNYQKLASKPIVRQGQFFHIFMHRVFAYKVSREVTECRLYVNIKAEYVPHFINKLFPEAVKAGETLYFKYAYDAPHNDKLIVYTTFAKAEKVINILNKIIKENYNYVEGMTNNILWAKVNDHIGFGSEPVDKSQSYTSNLSNLVVRAIEESIGRKTGVTKEFIRDYAPKYGLNPNDLSMNL